ncbi:glycosyltransferase [Chloropicon primus]|uniref:Glycosyltransferase n=1 Tax=Chloropicon primus TaxID=1764295 RepID=A0A5B8MF69_9CHLO|nr:glycosyltransferase [Chloropicon primus]UPQ98497.1 glycosyltransferase [Chloropicon primus]|eukprot:QDZ19288.1 glycosyltransferase [Chloropicon primus]
MFWNASWWRGGGGEKREKGIRSARRRKREKISVIVPTLNEAGSVEKAIRSARRTTRGAQVEVIVVDGGSEDATVKRARSLGAKIVRSGRGRGLQQDMGSKAATGNLLLFLHADTELPRRYDSMIHEVFWNASRHRDAKHIWGAFGELGIRSKGPLLRCVEFGVKQRTKYLGMPYGDQCHFFHRKAYQESGGYKHIPFMEVGSS